VLRVLTSLTVTASFPDARLSGGPATSITGAGWACQGVEHVGSEWVCTFQWTGTLNHKHPNNSTDDLGFKVRSSSA